MIVLPLRFLKFWYPDSLLTFIRTWHNTLNVLEEDLAVTLMLRLLFVPLFHDSSFVGRVLSFIFRMIRILIGLSAFLLVTIVIFFMAMFWFASPFLILLYPYYPLIAYIAGFKVVLGLVIFFDKVLLYPKKTTYQIKSKDELFDTTKLKKESITLEKLLQAKETKGLLDSLEIKTENFTGINIPLSDMVLEKAWQLAKDVKSKYLSESIFFTAMLFSIPNIDNMLLVLNLKTQDFVNALNLLVLKKNKWRKIPLWDEDFAITHLKGVNRGWLSAPTPALDSVSEDLTRYAQKYGYPEFVGRQTVVSEVVNVLSGETGRNVIIVGHPGAGKSALVKYLARIIIAGNAPGSLATKRLVELQLPKLMSQVTSEGQLAEKIKEVFEEVQFIQDIIIFVDEIHNLGVGDAGSNFNLYSLLMPYIESDRFQFIGTTENENYTRILEKNGSFARLFHKIELPPSSVPETLKIIQEQALELLKNKRIDTTMVAINEIVDYAHRLIHDRVLPDAAISLFNDCRTQAQGAVITSQTVKDVLSRQIDVPVIEVDQSQKENLLHLEDAIHQKLIDQQEAVSAVSDALRRAAANLREQNRPIGSFLFVGPTGVGKTELAKTLSEVFFKTKGAFLSFDMSEYQSSESVQRLLGTENNPGELTEAIRQKPYCLLLLDEFEKADPKLLTLFLQVLEEGRLTDYSGREVDFTNTIIIATSNAASLTIAQGLQQGKTIQILEQEVQDELLKIFKPELINRFDKVVIFKPLSPQDLNKVVRLKLTKLTGQLKEQGYLIDFSEKLIDELSKRGFDPVLGARPLRRLIQDTIEAKLSRLILENKLPKGQQFTVEESIFESYNP